MPLFGNLNLANSAPKWNVGGGEGIAANGVQMFANTGPNTLHSNLTIGVYASTMTKVTIALPVFTPGAGYAVNDLLTVANTGAAGTSNVDVTVNRLGVAYANVMLKGAGYANGTILQFAGPNAIRPAKFNVTVGDAVLGNVSTISLVDGGVFTANFTATNNQLTVLTGAAGNGASINIGSCLAGVNIHNIGAYVIPPTTLNNAPLVGGTGVAATANITLGYNAQVSGGSGWVLRTAQDGGQVQYEILVAAGSMQANSTEYPI